MSNEREIQFSSIGASGTVSIMPINVKGFLVATFNLSAVEVSAFFHLLAYYWQHKAFPDADDERREVSRLSSRQWARSGSAVCGELERQLFGRKAADQCLSKRDISKDSREAIPKSVRSAVIARDGLVCVYCGDQHGPFDLDHRMPWSRGGQNTVDNLAVACQRCNRSKGALTDLEFMGDPS